MVTQVMITQGRAEGREGQGFEAMAWEATERQATVYTTAASCRPVEQETSRTLLRKSAVAITGTTGSAEWRGVAGAVTAAPQAMAETKTTN